MQTISRRLGSVARASTSALYQRSSLLAIGPARVGLGLLASSVSAAAFCAPPALPSDVPPAITGTDIVLYQYEVCPYCCKLKAFLDYYNIPYRIVEVNPLTKAELKVSEYRKVPIVFVDGEQVNDSSVIIDSFTRQLHEKGVDVQEMETEAAAEEQRWRTWVDEKLVILLPPNIYRSPAEASEAFDYITKKGNFNYFTARIAKYGGAGAMYMISKKLKTRHGIQDEREELYQRATEWTEALGNRPFLGGDRPNLADLSVFGVLRSIEGLTAFRDMREHSPIGSWYDRMAAAVGTSSRLNNKEASPN